MRHLLPSLLILCATAALAQTPPPKKPQAKPPVSVPAPGSAPGSKEAPKPGTGAPAVTPCPAPQTAQVDAAAAAREVQHQADVALARALLAASEPAPEEIKILALEEIALLGDPRALNMLASFVFDPNPNLQAAAVKAIRSFQHPRAEEILANLVRHPKPPEALRLAALEALAFQRTASAAAIVKSISADTRLDRKLQDAARDLLPKMGAP